MKAMEKEEKEDTLNELALPQISETNIACHADDRCAVLSSLSVNTVDCICYIVRDEPHSA